MRRNSSPALMELGTESTSRELARGLTTSSDSSAAMSAHLAGGMRWRGGGGLAGGAGGVAVPLSQWTGGDSAGVRSDPEGAGG